MRIVLDTNVVVSALLWRGTPHLLLAALGEHTHVEIKTSPALLEELVDVLRRPRVAKQLHAIGQTATSIISDYTQILELVEPVAVPRVVPNDADDDHVIAAAIAAEADLIVSGDVHLLELKTFQGIEIVSASEALLRLRLA